MYVHCRNCGFSQDDFWSTDGYHPFEKDLIDHWMKVFADGMNGKKVQMDEFFAKEGGYDYILDDSGTAQVDFRQYLAFEMESVAKTFYNMQWITLDEYSADEKKECPACGCTDMLSVD